jgi:hypothetical protein
MKRGLESHEGRMSVGKKLAQKLFLVVFGLVVVCFGFAATEGVLRLLDLGDPHLYQDPFVGFYPGQELFSRKTLAYGREVYATNPGKLRFFNYQEFSGDKPTGAYRIFALGGSTSAGRP